ncbi:MAG: leucyl aminopeptidase family protein [Chitinophagaceae bacterium]|nr:leucyl aminopeptidase family protein [Oligoflexus sp.]
MLNYKSWKDYLPQAHIWLETLKVEQSKGLSAEAWNLVGVKAQGDDLILNSSLLDEALKSKVQGEIKTHQWSLAEKTLRLVIEGKKFLLVAQSSVKTTTPQLSRQLGMDAAAHLSKSKHKDIHIPELTDLTALDVLEGFLFSMDDGGPFKSKSTFETPKKVSIVSADADELHRKLELVKALSFTRWLQEAPSNFLNSEQFATIATDLFHKSKAEVVVLGRKDMEKLGMGLFLSVAHGTDVDPKLVCIKIPGVDTKKTVALVGKGVTFDAGGINIKPSAGLEEMKYDMSGAAAVFGSALYFNAVKPPVNVICALGAVENMLGPRATRPGDVVKSYSGKTVEILNTDAEGRLVLADVLSYVIDKHDPDLILDIATLTGAVIFGLGHAGAGFVAKEQKTADYLNHITAKVGEPMWQLPFWPELESEITSTLADLKNIPSPSVKAGPIMGGYFLRDFVKDAKCQWAHLDVAGTAWSCGATGFPKVGGSAYGVRSMIGAVEMFEG